MCTSMRGSRASLPAEIEAMTTRTAGSVGMCSDCWPWSPRANLLERLPFPAEAGAGRQSSMTTQVSRTYSLAQCCAFGSGQLAPFGSGPELAPASLAAPQSTRGMTVCGPMSPVLSICLECPPCPQCCLECPPCPLCYPSVLSVHPAPCAAHLS